jgi:hypothetical protein
VDVWVDWLARLQSRLPELERQLAKFEYFPTHGLPKGLFQNAESFDACIESIRRDIEGVRQAPEATVTDYLVKHIHQKIAVLVHLCRMRGSKIKSATPQTSLLTALSTREQWLAELSATKTRLLRQQSALITRIAALDVNTHTKMALALRAELSDIERELNGLHEINSKIT